MSLEYVDLATAQTRRGTRIVAPAQVASPWAEAAKGLFALAELPAAVVATPPRNAEVTAWAGADNVPVVLHDDDPPRTNWAAIVGLVSRLAPGALVPTEPAERAHVMGLVDLVAGEGGLSWTARLVMVHESFASNGERGFALPIAKYLAKRYGFSRSMTLDALREQARAQLAVLAGELRGPYFGGERANAVDVYVATCLTALVAIDDTVCPQMGPLLRQAFRAAHAQLSELVPDALWAQRARIYERLGLPIRLA